MRSVQVLLLAASIAVATAAVVRRDGAYEGFPAWMAEQRVAANARTTADASGTMRRVTVKNYAARLAVANDGSPQIFYYRPGTKPDLWMLYLEGGWWCISEKTCADRYAKEKMLMSSTVRPDTWPSTGWYSTNATETPFHEFNVAYMPYLTSDGFIGNASALDNLLPWQFRGRPALTAVIEDLFQGFTDPFDNSTTVKISAGARFMLSGSSAGGFGAIMNADYAGDLVASLCSTCVYSVLADSGFFAGNIDDPLRTDKDCDKSVTKCPYPESVTKGGKLWRSEQFVEPSCAAAVSILKQTPLHCLFGEVAVMFIKSRIMYVEFLFDAVALYMDGCDDVVTPEACMLSVESQLFVAELAAIKRDSLLSRASYVPSCFGHVMGFNNDYDNRMKAGANRTTLGEAVADWFFAGSNVSTMDNCTTIGCRACPKWP